MADSYFSITNQGKYNEITLDDKIYWVGQNIKHVMAMSTGETKICDYCYKHEFQSRSNPYYYIELIEDVAVKDEVNYSVCPECYKGVGKSLKDAHSFKVFMSLLKIRKGK